jgi:hypothetical protein
MTHSEQNGESSIQTAGMIAALTHIDGVGFHALATSITKPSPKIDPDWSTLLRNAGTAVASVTWPQEIRRTAERFSAAAGQLAAALDQDDIPSAQAPAREVHGAYHALSDAGWKHLSIAAGTAERSGAAEGTGAAEGIGHHHHGH